MPRRGNDHQQLRNRPGHFHTSQIRWTKQPIDPRALRLLALLEEDQR